MPPLDADLIAMLDRVRKIFGDEILAGIFERAQNATIRQAGSRAGPRHMHRLTADCASCLARLTMGSYGRCETNSTAC